MTTLSPDVTRFTSRQSRLADALQAAGLDALVLNPSPSLVYLTGMHFHLMERPVVVIFSPGAPVVLVIPELEIAKAQGLPFPAQVFTYNDDPVTWPGAYRQALLAAEVASGRVGVEPVRMRYLELSYLQQAAPQAQFTSAEAVLSGLRIRKDPQEIAAMRRAVDFAQRALAATLPLIRIGMTERELAGELVFQLLRAGSSSELPFQPIVSGGPNGANPHATPSERPLHRGELLVIDWGAGYGGYGSDLTRTFALGPVEPELERIVRVTAEANAAGRAAGAPGVPAGAVDKAARDVIETAGYGPYFIHRTGHGIGIEDHEEPYMRAGNPLLLEEGMAYTVEPGIYLPNRNGVRIEDDVIVTASGSESLSDFPRDLRVVGE